MASWTKPENTESLQCIACAAHQYLGGNVSHQDLLDLMRRTHPQQSTISDYFGIDNKIHDTLVKWRDSGEFNRSVDYYMLSSSRPGHKGYVQRHKPEESYKKIEQMGPETVNEFNVYIKFDCLQVDIILPKKKPVVELLT